MKGVYIYMKKFIVVLALVFCLTIGIVLLFESKRINKELKERDECINSLEHEVESLLHMHNEKEKDWSAKYMKAMDQFPSTNKYYNKQLGLRKTRKI
jgi:cell division GTPase FtsZ